MTWGLREELSSTSLFRRYRAVLSEIRLLTRRDRIAHFNFDVAAANNERRKSSASIEQLRLALRRQSLHNCRKQSVSIYIRAIRD
jgi:hypothetical protein